MKVYANAGSAVPATLVAAVALILTARFVAATEAVTSGAGSYQESPAWLMAMSHAVVPLVIVTVAPALVQPPVTV